MQMTGSNELAGWGCRITQHHPLRELDNQGSVVFFFRSSAVTMAGDRVKLFARGKEP